MSGRLRILPHKSWHVWTTENIEKVKKDERLHKEEVEASAKKSRDIHAEKLLSQLLKKDTNEEDSDLIQHDEEDNSNSQNYTKDGHVAPIKHVRINREAENVEYKREREEKELLQKRREGSAPYQLVPDEYTKQTPWYMTKKPHAKKGSGYHEVDVPTSTTDSSNTRAMNASNILYGLLSPTQQGIDSASRQDSSPRVLTSRGKRLEGPAAVAFLDRDSSRKDSADPMAQFLHQPAVSMTGVSAATTIPAESTSAYPSGPRHNNGESGSDETHVVREKYCIRDKDKEQKEHENHHKIKHNKKRRSRSHSYSSDDLDSRDLRDADGEKIHKHQKKKKRKSHHFKSDKDKRDHKRSSKAREYSHNNVSVSSSNSSGNSALDASLIHALRQKRLDRERDAQLKTELLISRR